MRSLLDRIRKLKDEELMNISEAIDNELERRLDQNESIPDSARRRAVERSQSYRRRNGAQAPPVKVTGLPQKRRPAA